MRNEVLNSRQIYCMLSMFLIGSAAILGGRTEVEQDSWIALLMGAAFSVPVLLILVRLNHLFPETGFYELQEQLFGKVAGKILTALMTWYCLHLGAMVLRNFSEFVSVCVMPETPQIPILFMVMLAVVFLARSGVETMGKWSVIMFPALMVMLGITIGLSFNMLDPERILPIMGHPIKDIADNAYMFLSFPFLETVVFLCAFQGVLDDGKSFKPMVVGFLLAVLALTAIDVRNTMLLGGQTVDSIYFPSYVAVKVIRLGEIVSRIEGSLSMNYVIGGVAKISVCLVGAAKGLKSLFGLDAYHPIILPVGMLMAGLCTTLYENVIQQYDFLQTYQIYAIPFQLIIPILTWIFAEIKAKKQKNQALQPARTQA